MSTMKILTTATLLLGTLATAGPALAFPAVIDDPGYCAQYYPNANCQNLGPGNPYTDPNYNRDTSANDSGWRAGYAMMGHHRMHWHRPKHHMHRH